MLKKYDIYRVYLGNGIYSRYKETHEIHNCQSLNLVFASATTKIRHSETSAYDAHSQRVFGPKLGLMKIINIQWEF